MSGHKDHAPLLYDGPSSAKVTLVLAHGAGAPMDSPFMQSMAEGLAERGIRVVRFEFPYMAARRSDGKRSAPNRMPVLEAAYRDVVAQLPKRKRLFVGGKSMGGRVAVHVADALGARGVVALGYPFHPPQQPDKLRLEPLRQLRSSCLIVQGTRDALGSRAEVESFALPAHFRVHWLEDGDHSFEPRKPSGRTVAQNMAEVMQAVASFVLTE